MQKDKLKNVSLNTDKTMLADELPPMGVVVEALVRYTTEWGKVLKGRITREEVRLIRRIPSQDNSRGWNWSHPDIKTYSTGEVIWWRFR